VSGNGHPVDVQLFRERTDTRLGRHQVHDERSRAFALAPVKLPTKRVLHERSIPVFDQQAVGCCTACAQLGMLSTGPLDLGKPFTIDDVHGFYHDETVADEREIPGVWPPTDTGSAGVYACKVAKARGWIVSYRHAFDVTTAIGWLGKQPISIGIPWLVSMFEPNRQHVIPVDRRSGVAGGHQVCLDGVDPARSLVRVCNSWGPSFGDHGWAWLRFADLAWLLSKGGDAVTASLH
jgi:hypothetical protein